MMRLVLRDNEARAEGIISALQVQDRKVILVNAVLILYNKRDDQLKKRRI